ncbi:MAG: hypothetical protein H6584_08490 [Flavobacteriales bacterium]|nr:hypothetical protein [Flavobacteriales bacterium]
MTQVRFLAVLFAMTLISSCNQEEVVVGETYISSSQKATLSNIPFTDDATLDEINANPDNVPYQTPEN